jgi:O-antigen/teichoic acid export membrane protein
MQKKNFIFTAISIGSRLVAGLLLFVFLARIWGPEYFGMYSFAFGLSMTLVLIVDFGFASYLLREIGAEPLNIGPVFREGLRLKSLLIIPFLLASTLTFWFFYTKLPILLFVPMLLSALMLSFSEYCIAPLRALGRYDIETGIITVSNIINFGVAASVALMGGGVVEVACASLVCRFQYFVTSAIALYRIAPIVARKHSSCTVLKSFQKLLPYGTDGVLSTAWNQLDVVLVGSLFGNASLGIYSAGQKVVQGLYTLAQVIGNVMIPLLARLHSNKLNELSVLAIKTIFGVSVIGFIVSLPLFLFPDRLVEILFGSKYEDLNQLMPFFSLVLVLRFISAGSGIVLTAVGMQSKRNTYQGMGIVLFLALAMLAGVFDVGLVGIIGAYAAALIFMVISFQLVLNPYLKLKSSSANGI